MSDQQGRRPMVQCVCGARAKPERHEAKRTGLGGILIVCSDECGFESGAELVASVGAAAELWADAVAVEQITRAEQTQTKAGVVRQTLKEAELAADPLAKWAQQAETTLAELKPHLVARAAPLALALALVRISQVFTAGCDDDDGS